MYFLRGGLPWQGVEYGSFDRHRVIAKCKDESLESGSLCASYPVEFSEYFEHCRELRFEDQPNYDKLRQNFRQLALRQGYQNDLLFDWMGDPASKGAGCAGHLECECFADDANASLLEGNVCTPKNLRQANSMWSCPSPELSADCSSPRSEISCRTATTHAPLSSMTLAATQTSGGVSSTQNFDASLLGKLREELLLRARVVKAQQQESGCRLA